MNTMPTPLAFKSLTTLNSWSISLPVSAAVGSSKMSTRAFMDSALAISTSCWRAMPSSPTGVSSDTSTPIMRSALSAFFRSAL